LKNQIEVVVDLGSELTVAERGPLLALGFERPVEGRELVARENRLPAPLVQVDDRDLVALPGQAVPRHSHLGGVERAGLGVGVDDER
jgi:hypothetical protein